MCVYLFTPDMIENVHSVEIRFVISKVGNFLALCLLMDRYKLNRANSKKLLLYLHHIITYHSTEGVRVHGQRCRL